MSEVEECPVLRPTEEEFRHFENYMKSVEQKVLNFGIVRIVPPSTWLARSSGYGIENGRLDFPIKKAIEQNPVGAMGIYRQYHVEKGSLTFQKYRSLATNSANSPAKKDLEWLQKRFWSSLGTQAQIPAIYAADIPDRSLFEDCAGAWDLRNLDSLLQRKVRRNIEGVTSPTLFAGMWRTCFSWHTEDYDLLAINYLHYGAQKQWWCVPQHAAGRFQSMCEGFFSGQKDKCRAFLRHKTFLVSPHLVRGAGLPIYKCTQNAGEFVVVFPGAFHCGCNLGFNVAEACNFALPSWVPHGLKASRCTCRAGNVQIDMRLFLTDESSASDGASDEEEPAPSFVKGDIVWAHLPGHPAWPSRVSSPVSPPQRRELNAHPGWVLVIFIGEGDWAVVPPLHLEHFPGDDRVAAQRIEACTNSEVKAALQSAIRSAHAEASSKRARCPPPPARRKHSDARTASVAGSTSRKAQPTVPEVKPPVRRAEPTESGGCGETESLTTQKLMETLLAVTEKRIAFAAQRDKKKKEKKKKLRRWADGAETREGVQVLRAPMPVSDDREVLWPARVWQPLTGEQKREAVANPGKLLVVWYGTGQWALVAPEDTIPISSAVANDGIPPALRATLDEAETQALADVMAGGSAGRAEAADGKLPTHFPQHKKCKVDDEPSSARSQTSSHANKAAPLWYEGDAVVESALVLRPPPPAQTAATPVQWLRAAEGLLRLADELEPETGQEAESRGRQPQPTQRKEKTEVREETRGADGTEGREGPALSAARTPARQSGASAAAGGRQRSQRKRPAQAVDGGRGSFARAGRQATSMFSDYRDALARAIYLSKLDSGEAPKT